MHEPVIVVEQLGKRYRLGRARTRATSWRGALWGAVQAHWHRLRALADPATDADCIWALRDVSLEVHAGEVVGVIGRNGSGKSTLLKILSRVVTPTTGRAEIRGRVGSLLEVGTGFHPELTGRENIFLNGAILGMAQTEIRRKFDEIVAFAEIERFLDTPVKRYSSGMYVRLAFAVAAHLEPEVLLVDEVLAVGDAAFQRKCLGKMGAVARGGRTILFVSHSMKTIQRLCQRAVWLDGGAVRQVGDVQEVTQAYLDATCGDAATEDVGRRVAALPADRAFRLREVEISQNGCVGTTVSGDAPVRVRLVYEIREAMTGFRVFFDLCDESDDVLVRSFHDEDADAPAAVAPGTYETWAELPAHLLAPREYVLRVSAGLYNVRTFLGDGLPIRLTVRGTSRLNRAYPVDPIRAKLQPLIPWQTRCLRPAESEVPCAAC